MLGTGLSTSHITPDDLVPFIFDEFGGEYVHITGGVYSSAFGAYTVSPSTDARATRYPIAHYTDAAEVIEDVQRRANETGKRIEWSMEISGVAYPEGGQQ